MINLKENEYIQISENSYLCYCQRWGSDQYYYMVAISQNSNWPADIYGWGLSSEEALLMCVKNLVKLGMKSISLDYEEGYEFTEFLHSFTTKEGGIAMCEEKFHIDFSKIPHDEKYRYSKDECFGIIFENGKCYPIVQ